MIYDVFGVKVESTVATTKDILLTDCYQSLTKYYEKQHVKPDDSKENILEKKRKRIDVNVEIFLKQVVIKFIASINPVPSC